jgi:hypothetical protein
VSPKKDLKGRRDVADYEKPDQNAKDPRLDEYIKLVSHVNSLSAQVAALSGMQTMGNVLQNGFKTLEDHLRPLADLPAQLAPLRDLAPERPPIPAAAGQAITAVLTAMERPRLPGIGSLGIGEANVPFIGQLHGGPLPGQPQPVAVPLGAVVNLPGNANLNLAGLPSLPGQHTVNQPAFTAPTQQTLGGGIKP